MTDPETMVDTPDARDIARILVISGVNLGLLGQRQPEIYGTETLEDHVARARRAAEAAGAGADHFASDAEAEIVAAIAGARTTHDGIIINPGAFTHYSWAIHDALAAFDGPVIELHISNPSGRESWRSTSVVSPVANAVIAGFGGLGYEFAMRGVLDLLDR